jgi:hypothetical protein
MKKFCIVMDFFYLNSNKKIIDVILKVNKVKMF